MIFLDIDGVLITGECYEKFAAGGKKDLQPSSVAIAELNRIIEATESELVISSTWRLHHDVPKLQNLLTNWGVKGKVTGATPWLMGEPRGREIQTYINGLGESTPRFVIIDDDLDMEHLSSHLVSTRFKTGLTRAIANKAIKHLKAKAEGRKP